MNQLDNVGAVIVVCGSAGSLEPIRTLFSRLPVDLGATFFIAQHLSPSLPSHLPELVSRTTAMPVAHATDGSPLEPNTVVVCPPGQMAAVSGATLVLEASLGSANRLRPIDHLCRSVAAERGANAAVVIFSGAGEDGAEGARAVKEAGGAVFVQSPGASRFSSMPEHVIKQGIADLVADPEALAEGLARWVGERRLQVIDAPWRDDTSGALFSTVLQRLKQCDPARDFAAYKPATMRRRIDRRMGLLGCATVSDYLTRLDQDPAEITRLSADLLIGVTGFFRDATAFATLEEQVVPLLCRRSGGEQTVRVWVAGCSTGEEAYSVAMAFADWFTAHSEPVRLKVFATDLDPAAIEHARAGRYSRDRLAGVSPERLARYFDSDGTTYRIKHDLRECVVFAIHNLLQDPPYSKLDLVVCRNVLIYLNRFMQRKVLSIFHFGLNASGHLFLGKAETVGSVERHFEIVSKSWRIYRKIAGGRARWMATGTGGNLAAVPAAGATAAAASDAVSLTGEQDYGRLLFERGVGQILLGDEEEVLYVSGDTGPYLRLAPGRPSRDIFRMVAPELEMGLRLVLPEARSTGLRRVVNVPSPLHRETHGAAVRIEVTPMRTETGRSVMCVAFSALVPQEESTLAPDPEASRAVLQRMKHELASTREELRLTVEQARTSTEELRATNEEVMSMNEELQSTNEELESSKEELQSLNEELQSANAALDAKVVEAYQLNADLRNFMDAALTPILLLDERLNVRRFTTACTKLMRINADDVGRPLDHIVRMFDDEALAADSLAVLAGGTVPDREIVATEERWYIRRVVPMHSSGSDAAGVVVLFVDISQRKRSEHVLRERSERLQWQADLLDKAAPIFGRDLEDRIIFWNAGAERLYGWTEAEAMGRVSHELLGTEFPAPLASIRKELNATGAWKGELRHRVRDGRHVLVESQWTLFSPSGGIPQAIVEVNEDITGKDEALHALRRSEAMFHTMLDWTFNLECWLAPDGTFVYVSLSAERITGFTAEELTRNPALLDAIVDPRDTLAWARHVRVSMNDPSKEAIEIVVRIVRKNGELRWVHCHLRAVVDDGRYLGRRITMRDITEQRLAEEQVRELAYFDPLTHLPNRRLVMDRLGQALVATQRDSRFGAVLMLDIDRFKSLNDTRGHDVGDRFLVEVGRRLRAATRQEDTVARLGGDEFLILIEGLDSSEVGAAKDAETVAEQARTALASPFLIDENGAQFATTVSIGVTMFRGMGVSSEVLLKQADIAMYQAKEAGRNAIRYFNAQMQAAVDERAAIDEALRRALAESQFALLYQPMVDRSGQTVGVEALIRWQRTDGSTVSPADFIPIAEETGLIVQIGAWVLSSACAQIKQWAADPLSRDWMVSVNVSARQFFEPDFVRQVQDTLSSTGADPARLKIELTESAVLHNVDDAIERMAALIALGVGFSLDDFGTGYSSLAYVKRLPIREVKIDRTFVQGLPSDANDVAIVRAIVALGTALGLEVVAEGVESPEQRDFLLGAGCTRMQGYLFGRPMPPGAVFASNSEWVAQPGQPV